MSVLMTVFMCSLGKYSCFGFCKTGGLSVYRAVCDIGFYLYSKVTKRHRWTEKSQIQPMSTTDMLLSISSVLPHLLAIIYHFE